MKKLSFKGKLLTLALIIIFSIPALISIRYAIVASDDFSEYIAFQSCPGNNIWEKAIYHTIDSYNNWGGGLMVFLYPILHPLNNSSNPNFNLRILLLILFLLFLVSLFTMIVSIYYTELDKVTKNSGIILSTAFIITEIAVLNSITGKENFTWYVGVMAYTLPLLIALFAISFYITYLNNNKISFLVLSSIFGAIGCTGILQVVAVICWFFLILGIIEVIKNNHNLKEKLFIFIPFVCSFISACINAFAPGNFARKASTGSAGLNIPKAVFYAISDMIYETYEMFAKYSLGFWMLIFFVIVLIFSDNKKVYSLKKLITSISVLIFMIFISLFPVCLGYSSYMIGDRGRYVCCFLIAISAMYITYGIARYLKSVHNVTLTKQSAGAVAVSCFMFLASIQGTLVGIKNGYSMIIAKEWATGALQANSNSYQAMYDKLAVSKGQDVKCNLTVFTKEEKGLYLSMVLDKDFWVNEALCKYYGARSLEVTYDSGFDVDAYQRGIDARTGNNDD